jgi:hypothetical protein
VKQFTLTYHQRGSRRLEQAQVFSDSLTAAETALLFWEMADGNQIIITSGQETGK